MSNAQSVGTALASFDAIRVDYQPQIEALHSLEVALAAAAGRQAGIPCAVTMLIQPVGTGKSYTLIMLAQKAFEAAGSVDGQHPFLRAQSSTEGSSSSVPSAILTGLGCPKPHAGDEESRWKRAVDEMQRANVHLLALDEFNRSGRRPTMTGPIGDSLCQYILEPGIAGIALVGTEAAHRVLKASPSLESRLDDEIDLSPLDWLRAGDDIIAENFLTAFDIELQRVGLFTETSRIGEPEIAKDICEAGAGSLRTMVKLLRTATRSAIQRRVTSIEMIDLREGADLHSIRRGIFSKNPFEAA